MCVIQLINVFGYVQVDHFTVNFIPLYHLREDEDVTRLGSQLDSWCSELKSNVLVSYII